MKSDRFTTFNEIFNIGEVREVILVGYYTSQNRNAVYEINKENSSISFFIEGFEFPISFPLQEVIYDVNEERQEGDIHCIASIPQVISRIEDGKLVKYSLAIKFVIKESNRHIPRMSLKDLLGTNLKKINNFRIYLKNCYYLADIYEFYLQKTEADLTFKVLKPKADGRYDEVYKIFISMVNLSFDLNIILNNVLDNIYFMFINALTKREEITCDYGKDTHCNQTMLVYI